MVDPEPMHCPHSGARRPRRADLADGRVELLAAASYEACYTPNTTIIGFAFEPQTGVHAFASDRRTGFRSRPNSLAYVPAGCEVYSQSNDGGEYLRIALVHHPGELWPAADRFSDVIDPHAIDAAQRLRRILLAGAGLDPLAVASLVQVLKARIIGVLSGAPVRCRAASWMTARRLRRVDDLIDARLAEALTVEDLATALDLSTGFFSRAFKAAVGKAPHDHIIDRRISRARRLLGTPGLDLGDVALACGFASHAHMSTTFRRRLGVSPSRLRADPV